jgi:hypothetical protein
MCFPLMVCAWPAGQRPRAWAGGEVLTSPVAVFLVVKPGGTSHALLFSFDSLGHGCCGYAGGGVVRV